MPASESTKVKVHYTTAEGATVEVEGSTPAEIVSALEAILGRNPFQPNGTQPSTEPAESEPKGKAKKASKPKAEPKPAAKEEQEPPKQEEPPKQPAAVDQSHIIDEKTADEVTLNDVMNRGQDLVAELGMKEARTWLEDNFEVKKLKELTESQLPDAYTKMGEAIKAHRAEKAA